jgi:hypothetical protein
MTILEAWMVETFIPVKASVGNHLEYREGDGRMLPKCIPKDLPQVIILS